MIADAALQAELQRTLEALGRLPLLTLLEQQGMLAPLLRRLLLERLRQSAEADGQGCAAMVRQICSTLELEIAPNLKGPWLAAVPPSLRPRASDLWNQLRLQRAMEVRYGERLEAHYLGRRADLEQVVFRMMRLERLGLAEELYLRLLDDEASFGDLAEAHALGEERHTRGLIGPIPLQQPHPRIRQALARLAPGELHPPFQLDDTVLVLRLERRLPARLGEALRQQLLRELLEQELEASTALLLRGLQDQQEGAEPRQPPPLVVASGGVR